MKFKTVDDVAWMEIYGQVWQPANQIGKTRSRIAHHKGIGWEAWIYPSIPGTCLGVFKSFQQAAREIATTKECSSTLYRCH